MGDQPAAGAMVLKEVGGFEIIAKIGQGSMGAVFKARQKSLDRLVALKILPPNIARNKSFIERFVREARASAKLTHPNVVAGIDVGQDAKTGLWYFAMEFVDGPAAKQLLHRNGKLEEDQALKIAKDIAAALDCAHQNNIVHRDVKPDNILLHKNGTAKLADLGLAHHTTDDAHLTPSGKAVGTPFYMAPEQVRGEMDSLDTRADLYALGATLFHLVTGQPPFKGESTAATMAKHISDPPPLADHICPEVSAGCSKLIVKLMQKDKTQRIQTPLALIEQIDHLLALPPSARKPTTDQRTPVKAAATILPHPKPLGEHTGSGRKGAGYAAAGAGVMLVLGLFVFLLMPSGSPQQSHKDTQPSPPEPGAVKTVPTKDEPKELEPQESPLERQWREAKAFAAAKPTAFDEILRRYRQVGQSAAGTGLASEVRAATVDVERRFGAAAKEALASVEKRMSEAAATGDYEAALTASGELPPALATRLAAQLDAKRLVLREEAEGKIRPVLEKAADASADADPAAGLKELASIDHITFQPLAEERQKLKQQLERELANVDELRARKAQREAGRKLNEILDRFDHALLEVKDESAALRIAREATGSSDLDPVRAQADALVAILNAGTAERGRQDDLRANLKGRPFRVGKETGAIDRVADGVLYVTISLGNQGSATKTFKIAELPPDQKALLFPPPREVTPALRAYNALQKLICGQEDYAAATEGLNAAPDFPLTPHYLELIQSRKAAVTEAEALKAWRDFEALAGKPVQTPDQALPVLDRLIGFFNAYGQTKVATEHAQEMATLRAKLEQLVSPNLLKNGGFETGRCDDWDVAVDTPEDATIVTNGAREGKACVRLARGTLSQTVHLTPGETYRASCWVKRADFGGSVIFRIDEALDPQLSRQSALAHLTEWTQWSITFTAQKAEHRITVALVAPPMAPGAMLVDDVKVVRPSTLKATASAVPPDAQVFGGHAYKVFPSPLPFAAAQQCCVEMGGHLVTIDSEREFEFVRGLVNLARKELWLGLSKRGEQWGWITGEPMQTNHWMNGTPDEGVAARMMQNTAKWNACLDARLFGFICEWDTAGAAATAQGGLTPGSAQFIAEETRTKGAWRKLYGRDGHTIIGDETRLPPYAQFSCDGLENVWEKETDDVRALDRVRGGKGAACWYTKEKPLLCDLKLTDGREHKVAFYLLDWRERGVTTKVEVLDAASGQVLDSRIVTAYGQGKYLTWQLKGSVQIRFTPQTGNWAFFSGVFFQ